jgi:hypothetical protein
MLHLWKVGQLACCCRVVATLGILWYGLHCVRTAGTVGLDQVVTESNLTFDCTL